MSRDGFRVYDGYKSILLPTPDSPANYPLNVTTLSEAKGAYNERLKQWIISFPTNSKTYKFDLRTGEFVEPAYNDEIDVWCETSGGNLLGCDGASIWVFDNDGTNDLTTYDGDTLDPYWKSKVYNMGSSRLEKILHEVTIRYKSNTELLFKYYIDGGSVQTMNGSPFTDNSAMTTVTAGFPIGTRGYEFEFELSCADTDTNTSFEVDHIIVGYEMGQTGRIE